MGKKRKTKKEKIILNLKRQLNQQKVVEAAPIITDKPQDKTSFSPSVRKTKKATTNLIIATQAIKKDLLKSFFLSAFAIACLFLLYSR